MEMVSSQHVCIVIKLALARTLSDHASLVLDLRSIHLVLSKLLGNSVLVLIVLTYEINLSQIILVLLNAFLSVLF